MKLNEKNFAHCLKDCPDNCAYSLRYTEPEEKIVLKPDMSARDTGNFLCPKLKKFFIRENHHKALSFSPFQESGDSRTVLRDLAAFLVENYHKKILFIRGSGSMGVNMAVWDYLLSFFPNSYYSEGSTCDHAAEYAMSNFFSVYENPDLKNIEQCSSLILFGKNAKATSPHFYYLLKKWKKDGKRIIYIDPVFSETADLADQYISLRPGRDWALVICLMLAWHEKRVAEDSSFKQAEESGEFSAKFFSYFGQLNKEKLLYIAGISSRDAEALLGQIHYGSTAFVSGLSLQRYNQGALNVESLLALAQISGNLENFFIARDSKNGINRHKIVKKNLINIAKIPDYLAKNFFDIVFVVAANPLLTYPRADLWGQLLSVKKNISSSITEGQADLRKSNEKRCFSVVVDTNLSASAAGADFYVRTAGMFHQDDGGGSYFFRYNSLHNPAALNPDEMKFGNNIMNDMQSALFLAEEIYRQLNMASKDGKTDTVFPADFFRKWQHIQDSYQRESAYLDRKTPDHIFLSQHFTKLAAAAEKLLDKIEEAARGDFMSEIERFGGAERKNTFRLLTVSHKDYLNSQLGEKRGEEDKTVFLHPATAARQGFEVGDRVELSSPFAKVLARLEISSTVHPEIVLTVKNQPLLRGWPNQLTPSLATDSSAGIAYYECFVDIKKADKQAESE